MTPSLDPARLAEPHILQPEWMLLRHGAVRDHAVVVEGGWFTAVGRADDVAAQFPSLKRLALPRMLLMPGMIDTHHHVTQSFGKSLVFGEPSEIFRRVWVPLEGSLKAEHLYLSSKLAALEALRGGFTTVVDAGTRSDAGLDAVARAVSDAGIRCVLGLICNDRPGAETLDADPILRRASAHLARYDNHALVTPSLAISIPEVATDAMLHRVYRLCAEAGRFSRPMPTSTWWPWNVRSTPAAIGRSNIWPPSMRWDQRRCSPTPRSSRRKKSACWPIPAQPWPTTR